ncbi:MAG: alpha/beta hydrolase, partial [Halieaceae bacterium]
GDYTIRHPDKVKRVALLNTLFGFGGKQVNLERSEWFNWIAKHYEAGTLEGILGELDSTVLSVMKIIGFENSSSVDSNWLQAYSAPFPDRESCIGAIEFPLDVHLQRHREYIFSGLASGNLDAVKSKPAMLAVGLRDRAIRPENQIADFKALFPSAPVNTFEGAGHFCQEDIPEILVPLIHQFIQLNR